MKGENTMKNKKEEFLSKVAGKDVTTETFDWENLSERLCKYYSDQFDTWWDPARFNWKDSSQYLCLYLPHKFDQWWDPDRFNWEHSSCDLCGRLPHKFDIWWDPTRFNWKSSHCLCIYLADKFDIWWDPEKFSWELASTFLCSKLSCKFDTWWIFMKSRVTSNLYVNLVQHCGEYLPKWFDPDQIPWNEIPLSFWEKYCSMFEGTWKPYYMMRKLE